MIETVLVPKDRIGVIKSKKAKTELEEMLNVKLSFDDNLVVIKGEGLELFKSKTIVKAIGRGFSPVRAFRLIEDEIQFELMDLGDLTENKLKRMKSRIIGAGGKTREYIESSTNCSISVYGKTISIIGTYEDIMNAKKAIEMIMDGARHSSVYRFLDKMKSKVKKPF